MAYAPNFSFPIYAQMNPSTSIVFVRRNYNKHASLHSEATKVRISLYESFRHTKRQSQDVSLAID